MEMITGPGLVLRRERHLDEDVKLTVLLRAQGKVTVISKGGLKLSSKLKAIQEPFSDVDFQLYLPAQRPYGRLRGGKLLNSYPAIRASMDVFQAACGLAEAAELILPARAPAPDVYDILRASFQALQQNSASQPSAMTEWVRFVAKLLAVLGHGDHRERIEQLLEKATLEQAVGFAQAQLDPHLARRLKSFVEVG